MQVVDMKKSHLEGAVETVRAHSGEFFYEKEVEAARARFETMLMDRDGAGPVVSCGDVTMGRQLVAVEGDRVLGTMGYLAEAGARDAYRLSYVAVHPDATRKGVGRRLWQAVLEDLKARGGRLVHTWTSPLPYTAGPRAFYESLGFKCVAIVPNHWDDGDDLAIFAIRIDGG